MEVDYGYPQRFKPPTNLDFYVLSNEDIGFTANLAAGVNDVYKFALPYPSSIDLFDETIKVYCIEFLFKDHPVVKQHQSPYQALGVDLSMLDKEHAATYVGIGEDAEDENDKAQFASHIFFGKDRGNIVATASVEGAYRESDSTRNAKYFPPIPLDLVTPLYIQFINWACTLTLATNVFAVTDFTAFERVQIRVWFTPRKLTVAEKSARAMQIRWQRLDS